MNGEQLKDILKGLEDNDLLRDVGHILTGYIGSATFCEAILTVLQTVRKYNPKVTFVCDPVLGDHGKFYVPEALVQVYKDTVIPLATVVTPNQFEVEQLTGIQIQSLEDARKACHVLHEMGPATVFITSMILPSGSASESTAAEGEARSPIISILASQRDANGEDQVWLIDCPMIEGSFTGTGDLTAALLLAHLAHHHPVPRAMEMVINTMYAVIQRTHESASQSAESRELKLIQSKREIENPPDVYKARKL